MRVFFNITYVKKCDIYSQLWKKKVSAEKNIKYATIFPQKRQHFIKLVLKGNLTFFFMTVSVKLGQKICGFTDIGFSKLRQKVVSLRLGVSVAVEAEGLLSHRIPQVSMNTTFLSQFLKPQYPWIPQNSCPSFTECRHKK